MNDFASQPLFMIIGGGIGGLCVAIALRQQGFRVKVFEQTPKLTAAGAGIAVATNALKALRELKLEKAVLNKANVPAFIQLKSHKGRNLGQSDVARIQQIYGASNALIHRADLHRILLNQLPNEVVQLNKKCSHFDEANEGIRVHFTDGSSEVGSAVIAADGIHSVIRQQLLPHIPTRYAGYTCWRSVVKLEQALPSHHVFTETWGPAGRVGIVPLSETSVYVFICVNAAEQSAEMKSVKSYDLWQRFKQYHAPIPQVIKSISDEELIQNDIIDLPPLPQYAFDRIVLMGDAAHATTPNMGQGACMAIEDAVILAQCLKSLPDIQQAFSLFEQKRMSRTHNIVRNSWRLGKIAQWHHPLTCALRNTAMQLIPNRINEKQLRGLFAIEFS